MVEPERMQRIIATRSGRQTQKIIGKSIARVLTVEIEAAARRMRTVIAVNGAVVVLISEAERVGPGDPVRAGLPVANTAPQPPGYAPGHAESRVAGDVRVRKSHPLFAARRWNTLNAGLFHQIFRTRVRRSEPVVRFQNPPVIVMRKFGRSA